MGEEVAATVFLTMRTDRSRYAPGDPVTATVRLRNDGPRPLPLRFATSQRYDFVLADADGRDLWRWSEGRMFAQMLDEDDVPAGEWREWAETFSAPSAPGTYVVTATLLGTPGRPTLERTIEVRA